MAEIVNELKLLIRSRYPIIYLLTYEEERAEALLKSIAKDLRKKLATWSITGDSSGSPRETGSFPSR